MVIIFPCYHQVEKQLLQIGRILLLILALGRPDENTMRLLSFHSLVLLLGTCSHCFTWVIANAGGTVVHADAAVPDFGAATLNTAGAPPSFAVRRHAAPLGPKEAGRKAATTAIADPTMEQTGEKQPSHQQQNAKRTTELEEDTVPGNQPFARHARKNFHPRRVTMFENTAADNAAAALEVGDEGDYALLLL